MVDDLYTSVSSQLALAVLVSCLAGCATDSGTGTTIEFWALGREGELVQSLIPEFERRNPGLRVRLQQIPWSAAHEKLLTAYVGEATPDVSQIGNTWVPEFVALNAIEPLDEWISSSSQVRTDDYFAGILDTNLVEGSIYALPWYVDTRLLFYRSDILQRAGYREAPRSWSEWIEAMTSIKQKAGSGSYAALLPMNEWQMPVILALQLGAELLRNNSQYGNFRSARFRRAFEFYLDLFRRGLAPRAGQAQLGNLYQDFAEGYFCFYVSGPWNIGELLRRLPAEFRDQWSTAPLPSPTGRYPGVSIAGGASLALFRRSDDKDAAWKWIEYLSEPRQQIEFYRLSGDLPARKTAWADPELAHNRYARAFSMQLQNVESTPKIPEWERIADKIAQYSETAIRGSVSTERALSGLDRDVDAILEKRRWLIRAARPAAVNEAP